MSDDALNSDSQLPFERPTPLVGGVNFTTWPDLKWSRANSHRATLEAKFNEWHASAPVSVDTVLREDRQGIDLVLRVPRGIPKHEWSLDLGDALHNLRSAFDAVAWGMAHYKDAKPTRPKGITFPICETEKQWADAVKGWVGEIPSEFQERLRIVQPYTHVPNGGVTVLLMLHELDIQDKHRDILAVSADCPEIGLDGAFEYEDHGAHSPPHVETRSDIKFEDGVVLGTIHAGAPIRMIGRMTLRPHVKVQLTYKDATHDLMPTLQRFIVETRRYLDILLFGLASPEDPGEGKWSPVEASSQTA